MSSQENGQFAYPAKSMPAWLLPAAIFGLALLARLLPGARTIDDAFITFRYARNLLAGLGFVYNPGEHVLGTTTPVYTLLMALLGSGLGGVEAPFPHIALVVNALADAASCLLLLWLGRRLGFRLAGVGAALAWAIAPFSVTFAIGGLETSLFVLLLLGMVSAHISRRRLLAALLGALALLTRPDALILVGPLALDRAIQWLRESRQGTLRPRQVLGEVLAFGLPSLAWATLASAYFGSPLPNSIAAKSLAYRLNPEEGLVRLLQHYGTPFLEHLTFGTSWIGLGLVLYLFLFILGSRRALQVEPHAWPLAAYPWLYFVVFAAANPLIFRWYLTPPLPAYFLLILGGLETLLGSLAGAIRRKAAPGAGSPRLPRLESASLPVLMAALVVLAPALLSLRGWRLHPDHGLDRPAPDMAWYRLELLYRQAAEELIPLLGENAARSPLLAAGDVGVLGFTTGARILDTVGLNSPQSSAYYPLDPTYYTINYAIPPGLILDLQPNYLVILEVYGREGLLKDPQFQRQYRLREKLETDIYGSDGLLILERIEP